MMDSKEKGQWPPPPPRIPHPPKLSFNCEDVRRHRKHAIYIAFIKTVAQENTPAKWKINQNKEIKKASQGVKDRMVWNS